MKATRLRTSFLENPIGISPKPPKLSWWAEGGKKQTAYRITAYSNSECVWDSGKVLSDRMTEIEFGGKTESRQRITYKVTLWDENDVMGDESEAYFETGLAPSDFVADFITGNYKVEKNKRYPVDCFRKVFTETGEVIKARIYVTACGLYEGMLNGERIGDFILAPGHTDYNKRLQYQTYDVTDMIKSGENELTFMLADGWYRGSCGAWGLTNQYGTETKLYVQLEMTHKDGSVTKVLSDDSWQWSDDGPIRFADNKDGETVDANMSPSYSGRAKRTGFKTVPSASDNVFVTEHEKFSPELIKTPSGKTVLDFGQNIAGYVSFSLNAEKGRKIVLRFGEMLDNDGEFTQKNIQCTGKKKTTPLQKVEYTAKEGKNEYRTKFAIFGFRYVLVEADFEINPHDFTAVAVYSDLEMTSQFDSSNGLLNAFWKATEWSLKNNSADVPTDCPTRERHGWTGDSQIFAVTAGYLSNYLPFARKHVNDINDWQRKDGAYPQIAPAGGVDFYMNTLNGSVGWADAGILIPYRMWKLYGSKELIKDHYDGMKKYARFMLKRCGKKTLLSSPVGLKHGDRRWAVNYGQSYGEWAEPADVFPNDWKDMVLPHPEVSTAYTAYIMKIMAEVSSLMNEPEEAQKYTEIYGKIKRSYAALRKTDKYTLDTDRQAMLVRPLWLGLLDGEEKEYAEKRLLKALDNYGWRLGTGFLSTPMILYVLSGMDPEYAYRLLENEEMPGWLFMPKMGATTIWESWEGTESQGGIASLDHYSKGAMLEWVFKVMCGINVSEENRFVISPIPGGNFTHASLKYGSIYGEIAVGWEKSENGYTYRITVPANTVADVTLPGREKMTLEAGHYVL